MSARFLFTCWPFTGHVLPQLSIAAALRDRGHEVVFHSGESARAQVEAEGFELLPFEAIDDARIYDRLRRIDNTTRYGAVKVRELMTTFRTWLVDTIPGQVADLRAIHADRAVDVVVADVAMWGPVVVSREADGLTIALSTIFMGPLIPGPDAPAWGLGLASPRTRRRRAFNAAISRLTEISGSGLRRRVDGLRAEYGLPPMGRTVNELTRDLPLYLVPSIPELDYGRRDLPECVQYVGACQWHPPQRPGEAAWLDDIPRDRPWVHVAESTLAYDDPFLLRTVLTGLAGAPVEVIATTGPQRRRDGLGIARPPRNAHVTDWLSHSELLQRCDVVVTNGGAGTILASLSAGVPLVVVPTTWDKPDNARRIVEAGVGVRLAPRHCTTARLRAAIEQVLDDPVYRRAARRMAQRLADAPGPAGAAKFLEALVPVRV